MILAALQGASQVLLGSSGTVSGKCNLSLGSHTNATLTAVIPGKHKLLKDLGGTSGRCTETSTKTIYYPQYLKDT
eukprot:917635-Amphidinium_carterae.2